MKEDNITWLARNVDEWHENHIFANVQKVKVNDQPHLYWSSIVEDDYTVTQHTREQWLSLRTVLQNSGVI